MEYFAYGSNMDPERMKKRGIRFSQRRWGVLRGWKLVFNKRASKNPEEGYANIIPWEGEFVEGILYTIPEEDIKILDRYEGFPDHYYRKELWIELKDGTKVKAQVYIAREDKTASGLKPSKEYLSHLLKGCDLLSKEYCERLKRQETL